MIWRSWESRSHGDDELILFRRVQPGWRLEGLMVFGSGRSGAMDDDLPGVFGVAPLVDFK